MWPISDARMSLSASHSATARNTKKDIRVRMLTTTKVSALGIRSQVANYALFGS